MPEFQIPGPPEARVKGLPAGDYPEIVRLSIFASDLRTAAELLRIAANEDRNNIERDAFCLTALVKLLGCFEPTQGLRQRPLKSRKVLDKSDRKRLDDLRQLRNKIAVHDEQLYPLNSVVAVVMPDATVERVWVTKATFPLHQVGGLPGELTDISAKVLRHVESRLDGELQQAAGELNSRDLALRKDLLDAPDYSVKIETENTEQARWKRKNRKR